MLHRWFGEDHVGIGTPHTEAADTGDARQAWYTGPCDVIGRHAEGRSFQVDGRIGTLEADVRGDDLPAQCQSGLDDTGHTGCGRQVPDVALDGSDGAMLLAAVIVTGAEGKRECFHFDGITQRGRRAMCFHVGDVLGAHTGVCLCHGDDIGLSAHAGCGEAGLVAAIVVQCRSTHRGIDVIAVAHGILQALEHHDAHAIAERGALAFGVEGAGAAIGAVHTTLVVNDAAVDGYRDGDTTGQGHVAFPIAQCLERLCDGHQRCAACGVDAESGAAQVELEGQTCGDVVLLVGGHHREVAHLFDQVGMADDVAGIVGVVAHTGIHADEPIVLCGIVRRILERGPSSLQEHPLLRVHEGRHPRVHPEETRIELVRIVDHPTGGDIVGVIAKFLGNAGVQFLAGPTADAVLLVEQVAP